MGGAQDGTACKVVCMASVNSRTMACRVNTSIILCRLAIISEHKCNVLHHHQHEVSHRENINLACISYPFVHLP
jgi:hypothetical protein